MNNNAPAVPAIPSGLTGNDLVTAVNDRLRRIQGLLGASTATTVISTRAPAASVDDLVTINDVVVTYG